MKKFSTGCAIALLTAACSLAAAQDSTNKNVERASEQRKSRQEARAEKAQNDEQGRLNHADKAVAEYFAGKLLLMDQSTIQLAQLAEERSTNAKVKQFARMLVDEHMKCSEKLRECAPGIVKATELRSTAITREAGFRGTTEAEDKADAVDQDGSDARRLAHIAESGPPLHRILAIDRQATENYIQSSIDMINKYEGQDFDMGFLGFTIGSHTWALAELKAMHSVGDEKFQELISDATVKVEQHLIKAEELSKEFQADFAQRGDASRPAKSTENAPVAK